MLRYRNILDSETKLFTTMNIFGHPIRDFIPILPAKYNYLSVWIAREEALRNRQIAIIVGDKVSIQNQVVCPSLQTLSFCWSFLYATCIVFIAVLQYFVHRPAQYILLQNCQ